MLCAFIIIVQHKLSLCLLKCNTTTRRIWLRKKGTWSFVWRGVEVEMKYEGARLDLFAIFYSVDCNYLRYFLSKAFGFFFSL